MDVQTAIGAFLAHREGKNVAPHTLKLYRRLLAGWCSWRDSTNRPAGLADVTIADFRPFLDSLQAAGRLPNTVDSYRRTLRAFWRFLEGEGLLSEVQRGIWANGRIPRPLGVDAEARPYIDRDHFDRLLGAAGDGADEQSARDRAILLLLWESGMRVGELCSLTDETVELKQRRATIVGKGRRRGYVFWGPRAAAALLVYLGMRRGPAGGPLLRGVSSRNPGGALTPNAVRLMLKRLGVELPKGAPVHALRHGFAHRSLNAGLEISQVQQLMRHTSIETTLRYLGERPERLQALHGRALGVNNG